MLGQTGPFREPGDAIHLEKRNVVTEKKASPAAAATGDAALALSGAENFPGRMPVAAGRASHADPPCLPAAGRSETFPPYIKQNHRRR
jgi:hypothetical protein